VGRRKENGLGSFGPITLWPGKKTAGKMGKRGRGVFNQVEGEGSQIAIEKVFVPIQLFKKDRRETWDC